MIESATCDAPDLSARPKTNARRSMSGQSRSPSTWIRSPKPRTWPPTEGNCALDGPHDQEYW